MFRQLNQIIKCLVIRNSSKINKTKQNEIKRRFNVVDFFSIYVNFCNNYLFILTN